MFNLKNWDATSSLSRTRRKPPPGAPTREPPANDADAPQRSRATDHHIQTFIDAQQNGDHAEQGYIFNNIVNAWRADNAAGGLPVYAHPPLPDIFADHLAATIKKLPENDRNAHLEGITANLEPGTRLSVLQQLGHAMTSADTALFEPHAPTPWIQPPDATPPAERMGLGEGLHILHSQTPDPHLKSLIADLIKTDVARDTVGALTQNRATLLRAGASGIPSSASESPTQIAARSNASKPIYPPDTALPPWPTPRPDLSPFNSNEQSENLTSGQGVKADETEERLTDYNKGNVAETVDDAVAHASKLDTMFGRAGMQVKGKGRYIWTRYGWVDLQHVISAATATNDPLLNLIFGVATEVSQSAWPKYWSSAWKKEDFLSNWIGAQALAYQRLYGGSIGSAVALVLKRYAPVSREEARKFIDGGGKPEPWGP